MKNTNRGRRFTPQTRGKQRHGGKRGSGQAAIWILSGILAVLLLIAAALYMNGNGDEARLTETSCEEGASGTLTAGEKDSEAAGSSEEMESAASSPAKEDVPLEITEEEAPSKPAAPSKPEMLESLSGLAPGTVLEPGQIDLERLDSYFMSWEIEEGDNLYARINGKSYRENPYVPLRSLRYLKMPHYNFDGQIQVGEMIVNKEVQDDIFAVFKKLFLAKYQIQSMYLIDNYWTGDAEDSDSASIDANNTSAFCYREISGGGEISQTMPTERQSISTHSRILTYPILREPRSGIIPMRIPISRGIPDCPMLSHMTIWRTGCLRSGGSAGVVIGAILRIISILIRIDETGIEKPARRLQSVRVRPLT